MPYRVRSTTFRLEQSAFQRAQLTAAHIAAEQAVLNQMQHDRANATQHGFSAGHAWVELDPSPFARWCKTQSPNHPDVPAVIPSFFGTPVPKTFLLRFLCPGAPADRPISIIAAQAGATAFAWHLMGASLERRPRVVSTWGARP